MGIREESNLILMKNPSKRRSFIKKAIGGSLLAGLLPLTSRAQTSLDGRFVHTVFFWLKNPDNEAEKEQFVQGTRGFLSKVKVIKSVHLGAPAGTPREVVDNSYDVCLVVTFDTKEDQDIYQQHEAHLQYIEEYKQLWKRVQVYDSWGFA